MRLSVFVRGLGFAAILLIQGCSLLEVPMVAMMKAPDQVYIHDQAKVGDKAIVKNPHRGHQIMIWEVLQEFEDGYEVGLSWQDETGRVLSFGMEPGLRRQFVIDKEGNVKSAKAKSVRFGLALPMAVAKPGTYVKSREVVKFETPQIVTTPLGQYTVTEAIVSEFDTALLDNKSIDLIDPNVSFGVVHSDQNVSSNVLAATNLYIEISKLQGQAFAPTQLNSVLTSIRNGGKIKQSFDLVEQQ
ncbi:MAG: hypothetical protein KBT87_01360 [Gammaproteobacteria bacterium]|jgi:hypothetical protein|nr:hypothetical protein [Gammaproteobacteria bacterium]MBQ0773300.1 hypothetical protein [Gammaproteobacteria bacterium]